MTLLNADKLKSNNLQKKLHSKALSSFLNLYESCAATKVSNMSKNHPAARLKQIIERKKKEDSVRFRHAESRRTLLQYLATDILLADIDPHLVLLYQESSWDFEVRCIVDSYVTLASEVLDNELFNKYYESQQPSDVQDYGISKSLLSVRSQYRVVQPIHKLKVSCVGGSFLFLGVGVLSGLRGRLPTAAVMAVASTDLLRVSYNCSDKQYGNLYYNSLMGNVSRACDTLYLSTKSLLGLIPLDSHPLLRLRTEVNIDILVQDTITQKLLRQARSYLKELR